MVNLKLRTGEAAILHHIQQAKDVYMTKLGSLGAYTCCNNIWPCLSITPPCTEEQDTGPSEEEDNDSAEVLDPCNVSPTPILPASGCHHKKSKDGSKYQCQQSSSKTSSQSDQCDMITNFISGHNCEEQDHQRGSNIASLCLPQRPRLKPRLGIE